jgi:hypothetical protein
MSARLVPLVLLLLVGCGGRDADAPVTTPVEAAPSAPAAAEVEAPAPTATPAASVPSSAPQDADVGDASQVDKAIDDALGDHAAYRKLFEDLQAAVRSDDKTAVAALIQYPLEASVAGKKVRVKDAAAFVADYDAIMTGEIKQAVIAQRYADLMVNWQGVMIGDGQVWLNGICPDAACKQSTPRVVTLQAGPK